MADCNLDGYYRWKIFISFYLFIVMMAFVEPKHPEKK